MVSGEGRGEWSKAGWETGRNLAGNQRAGRFPGKSRQKSNHGETGTPQLPWNVRPAGQQDEPIRSWITSCRSHACRMRCSQARFFVCFSRGEDTA